MEDGVRVEDRMPPPPAAAGALFPETPEIADLLGNIWKQNATLGVEKTHGLLFLSTQQAEEPHSTRA